MKGIILAGGTGSRLDPLTRVTSKQLLPVYDKPMIYYPLETLLKAGIEDILIIVAPEHCGDFMNLMRSGKQFGVNFTYEVQDKPEGLAQALLIADDFIENESCAMILGDNIFMDDLSKEIQSFESGATIFLKEVPDPDRFGVAEIDEQGNVLNLEEKPTCPKSNYAQTGLYLYDSQVIDLVKKLTPSKRGELEITDLNRLYLEKNELNAKIVSGEWVDAGTFESLFRAGKLAREKSRHGEMNEYLSKAMNELEEVKAIALPTITEIKIAKTGSNWSGSLPNGGQWRLIKHKEDSYTTNTQKNG